MYLGQPRHKFGLEFRRGASELTEGQMVSPMFGNLPPLGYNFLGCTRGSGGLTQVALGLITALAL